MKRLAAGSRCAYGRRNYVALLGARQMASLKFACQTVQRGESCALGSIVYLVRITGDDGGRKFRPHAVARI
jgi:hypothetical protein